MDLPTEGEGGRRRELTEKEREGREPHPLVHSCMLCHTGAEFPLGLHGDFHKVESAKTY